MSLLNVLNIAGSAMNVQSKKINLIANNLANIDTMIYKNGKFQPYISKQAILTLNPINNSTTGGVKILDIVDDPSPMKLVYDPNNPMANKQGYVLTSNVNPITETVNNITAARNYQANIEVIKTAKSMIMKTLTIIE